MLKKLESKDKMGSSMDPSLVVVLEFACVDRSLSILMCGLKA